MSAPQLWVWIGSPDDKLDVLRYVTATKKDILGQPIVRDALDAIRAKVKARERECDAALLDVQNRLGEALERALAAEVERDALAAENARLREALNSILPDVVRHLRECRARNDPRALSLTNDLADAREALEDS